MGFSLQNTVTIYSKATVPWFLLVFENLLEVEKSDLDNCGSELDRKLGNNASRERVE